MDRIVRPRAASLYAAKALERHYYYAIDTRGGLFLEEARHRNVATSLKDPEFLRSFYRMLRRSEGGEYPLVSPCGKELNHVLPEDPYSVLGFSELTDEGDLVFAGGQLKERFEPAQLRWSRQSGRLYHPLLFSRHLKGQLGLLHPQLAQSLVISPAYRLRYQGKSYPLDTL